MDFAGVKELVQADMLAVNRVIQEQLQSGVPTIPAMGAYLVNAGGKRLRPIILLLAARLGGDRSDRPIPLAAVVEFIHTATLLHDDVVDGSELRRSNATANQIWGNAAAILVGDFLYARSFEMMVKDGDMRIMATMAEATSVIAQGEVAQLENANDADLDPESYYAVIAAKTAKLFEAAARLAAIVNRVSVEQENALAEYGRLLGTAFQLMDDALDYEAAAERMGKNRGDDLADGKATLPFIHAMREASPAEQAILRAALADETRQHLPQVLEIIAKTDAIAYTLRSAEKIARQAHDCLQDFPECSEKEALQFLADFAVHRDH
ncbi:octaprenyl diphosphate synthase [Acidithiobacillus sp. CV18-2]|uniref:Octaprenyl diphosphate synthase n=1 Tax=Igneacidithiobacillus copahuensis TaxID=2724909 RepID=A0AAE2YR30_9PROT|nr:polyprenyl synthetase family protein [Igneacidithiobacillus copahuensis]MBU2753303.1 octaprenyl diphosphate synthase [Acidithiobacillus sp. CV18-3]MBU2756333.1 octaprenyl diphosphate synthase [Acidithiobacillus sp. BN09-2]MBU2776120.1 octaprenyl diphosphate synthase [Acidithiobacillus sp. CV18-2]MBU2795733.1 octaprenyl diphosphate synthase [Acidithiobacillus sp. VAN18-2]MBU2798727.1 octaprenyl diphosphate synthase [Acidithiobacillus sp. VAN18-4]UTV81627.1 polyprenyl synthetase family prote